MTRSSDDTSDDGGELNDSLIDYLNDAIHQQEQKVARIVHSNKNLQSLQRNMDISNGETMNATSSSAGGVADDDDVLEQVWKKEVQDGKNVETFNPNDPETIKVLEKEFEKSKTELAHMQQQQKLQHIPSSAEEKLLLLLKMLKERIKIEAAFGLDEKSRNLRVLSYCCNLPNSDLRAELIQKEFGKTLDRLDSFIELTTSSIEYVESTSYQLQPAKKLSLDVDMLQEILSIAKSVRGAQSSKASATGSRL
mmetsp:Transcript_21487/g.61363  ORF Transcript_21487/g.61363 Transcript_21487/m.61363 type:complete len:251 (-) Transcript_21487:56-808(-)